MKSVAPKDAKQIASNTLNRHGVKSQLTFNPRDQNYTKVTDHSLTVPDMTLTIQQTLDRFQNGLSLPVSQGIFTDLDLSGLDRMDKFELIDLSRRNLEQQELLKQDLKLQQQQYENKQREEDFSIKLEEELQKKLQEREQQART